MSGISRIRPRCSILIFALIYSIINLVLYNRPLIKYTLSQLDYTSFHGIYILIEVISLQILLPFLLVMVLAPIKVMIKPICIIFFIINAIGCYFIDCYNVILDKSMLGNIYSTDINEAFALYDPKLLIYIFLYGVIPGVVIANIKLYPSALLKRIWVSALSITLVGVLVLSASQTWLWFDKNFKIIGGLSMPMSYIVNSIRYFNASSSYPRVETKLPDTSFKNNNKTIVVLVIGESARRRNFALYGYTRDTNPYLKQDDVVAIQNVDACATYTTKSIQCILSHLKPNALWGNANTYEPLPTYIQRQNINVLWRSNNTGEPTLHVNEYEKAKTIKRSCHGSACNQLAYDEVLLYQLKQKIQQNLGNNYFVVLHQTGSHGPLYSQKYPEKFEKFQPTCQSVDLQKCTSEELMNAYDNTIVYTDYILHEVITTLSSFKNQSTVMLYLSDHGESLGESNFYLHGAPNSIAPSEQREVPFIVWMSERFKQEHHITNSDLSNVSNYSYNDIFYSVMGAFNMKSDFYNQHFDIFDRALL
ncbi:MAG: phosphoethanolamine--lipid A transferase EptA [Legionella sp.]|nr:phosphoethanolamine--lipid A transferase EptA [Legionella sp.]